MSSPVSFTPPSSSPRFSSPPVLFISGYTDDEMVRRGLIERNQPFLSKPFTPEILAAKARLLLDEAAAERR